MSTTLTAPRPQAPAPNLIADSPEPPTAHDMGEGRYRWTRDEYHRMAQAGLFDDKRVELLDGEVWTMPAQLTPHAVSVTNVRRALEAAFGTSYHARVQAPIALNDGSEPEPDLALVPGIPNDYIQDHPHPEQVALLMEVSDSTLRKDRGQKARDYAQTGIADYWIVNLVNRQLEIHREPSQDGTYQSILILGPTQSAAPLRAPDALIQVADLLPPVQS